MKTKDEVGIIRDSVPEKAQEAYFKALFGDINRRIRSGELVSYAVSQPTKTSIQVTEFQKGDTLPKNFSCVCEMCKSDEHSEENIRHQILIAEAQGLVVHDKDTDKIHLVSGMD